SEGPVKILLGSSTGTIAIAGKINAISSQAGHVSDLRIIARGNVNITGQVVATADMGQNSGDVVISAYGKISVVGAGAWAVSSARELGTTGGVHLKSEREIEISN